MNELDSLLRICRMLSNFGGTEEIDDDNAPIPRGCEVGNELVQVKFNDLPIGSGLSLYLDDKYLDEGHIGDVLKRHPEQAHNIITSYNWFYGIFVIRLKTTETK